VNHPLKKFQRENPNFVPTKLLQNHGLVITHRRSLKRGGGGRRGKPKFFPLSLKPGCGDHPLKKFEMANPSFFTTR
jgi:hypothetical protein